MPLPRSHHRRTFLSLPLFPHPRSSPFSFTLVITAFFFLLSIPPLGSDFFFPAFFFPFPPPSFLPGFAASPLFSNTKYGDPPPLLLFHCFQEKLPPPLPERPLFRRSLIAPYFFLLSLYRVFPTFRQFLGYSSGTFLLG